MRCVAVDWSGRAAGAAEHIWIAEVVDGELTFLENGRGPDAGVAWLAARPGPLTAGLDFSFSFPAWFVRERFGSAPAAWAAMADSGDALLAAEAFPFWGRDRRRWPELTEERRLRDTEARLPGAKSTFQIGGAGAVGTGSVRGMAILPALRDAGFAVWPFDRAGPRTALEIYPRAMYPRPVVKSSWRARHALLAERWSESQPAPLLERAAGSEDAFDAAVSALVMAEHAVALATPAVARDPGERALERLEGRVWTPPVLSRPARRTPRARRPPGRTRRSPRDGR